VNNYRKLILGLAVMLVISCGESEQSKTETTSKVGLVTTGELISTDTVTVSPPSVSRMWQYKIQYLIRENTKVKEGDVVIRFDSQQLSNELMSKQSELAAAIKEREQQQLKQAQDEQDLTLALAEAKMQYEKEKRKAEIVDEGRSGIEKRKQDKTHQIAQLKYQQAQQKVTNVMAITEVNSVVSEAKMKRLKIEVEQIKAEIEKLSVKAIKSGVVLYLADHQGEKVAIGDTIWQGKSVLTIPSLDKLAIKAEFDEPDTTKIAVNRKVKVTLDAYPELPLTGYIASLGQAYKSKSNQNPKIIFEAFIALEEIDSSLMRPGMKAKIELLSDIIKEENLHG